MCENVSVFRALQSVIQGGVGHKSVAVRAEVARLMDMMVSSPRLGCARVMGCSRECQELILVNGAKMLTDGSLEVRTHTKHLFAELMKHEKFEALLRDTLKEHERNGIKKALDSIAHR